MRCSAHRCRSLSLENTVASVNRGISFMGKGARRVVQLTYYGALNIDSHRGAWTLLQQIAHSATEACVGQPIFVKNLFQ
jgi:hypothetical protein